MIRGISDLLSDKGPGHDERWQPTASWHAAAFAFELIDGLTVGRGGARNVRRTATGAVSRARRSSGRGRGGRGGAAPGGGDPPPPGGPCRGGRRGARGSPRRNSPSGWPCCSR
ncbi:hypothetical protein NKH77_03470 [Streptomyces sp. M19]